MKRNEQEEIVYAPLCGRLLPLCEVADEVFSQGILGEGVAIVPSLGELYAPTDGKVTSVFESGHALTLQSDGGAELLLHVGLETVRLQGKGFTVEVQTGERVRRGQRLLSFDMAGIRAAGCDLTTPMVISGSSHLISSVTQAATVDKDTPVMTLKRRK